MVDVEKLRAIEGGDTVDIEYLGCLLWSTVSDVLRIPIEELRQRLDFLGLERFMPRKINPRDAFRRVTKSVEIYRTPYGDNTYLNLLVRDVKFREKEVVRQLVREVVDGKNARLEYTPVIEFKMEKEGGLSTTPLVNKLNHIETDLMDRIPSLQEDACKYYDGTHIRHMFRVMLQECGPVSVRPNGGVVFIPQRYAEMTEKIKELSRALNEYEGNVRMWSIPVIDATEHREMIEESLEEQVLTSSQGLIQDMKTIIESPEKSITVKGVQGYADRVRKLKDLVEEYEESLEFQATRARENLELARQITMKLMEDITEE